LIVLHSLDLAQRGTGPLGEADFVVIAPGFGVMVIEAKTYLSRTADGKWLTHPTQPPKERGPFQQANGALYRIKEWTRTHGLADVLTTSVVIVPDMDVTVGRDQIEWSPRQLIDRSRYRSKSLEQLTTLAPRTMARIDSDWRRKLREGVQKGDTVWLDTEQDLLISFFKRFRDNIYNVWNYPERARLRQEEGRCLLRIVVSRQGTIVSVDLLESSGSRDLDEEAIRAVRKGAPYGPLPSSYPHPQLNIMAYFNYSLTRSFIYGERP
jgi:TonB family protein